MESALPADISLSIKNLSKAGERRKEIIKD